jgi:hypothetical protein
MWICPGLYGQGIEEEKKGEVLVKCPKSGLQLQCRKESKTEGRGGDYS